MEIQQFGEDVSTKLLRLLRTVSDNQYVQCPCRVTAVNGNYVDVVPIINDDMQNQELYDVKIRHLESSTAYIFLGVHKGDKGILRFFDRSIDDYSISGSEGYNEDDRMHDVNDGLFELGFLPDNESYIYPNNVDIEIGLKNQSVKMSFTENGIAILGDVTITGSLTVSGEVIGNGIPLSTHKHTGVQTGSGTSGLPTI